ncbi:MAG: hypothetical protein ACF8SC_12750 [Phycisphaerales bacterium JB037]
MRVKSVSVWGVVWLAVGAWGAAALGVNPVRGEGGEAVGADWVGWHELGELVVRQPADWYSVRGEGGPSTADVEAIERSLELGAGALRAYFDDPALEAALRAASVEVIVHAEPGPRANEVTATTRTGTRDGTAATYFAEIHLLAPSSYGPGLLTSVGEPKDGEYFARLSVHELSTVPLDLATRIKPEGWRFRQAPAWFVQGYQEYLGMMCPATEAGRAALERRVAIVAAEPGRVDDSFGLDVRGPYVTGSVLLLFMHERYGRERVRGILTSAEPTFGGAVRASLGVGLGEFMRDFEAWIGARAGS